MTPTTRPTSTELVDALSAAGGNLDRAERAVALATYRLLALGRPVTHEAVAGAAGVSVATVDSCFAGWPAVFRDADDAVVGFWGLALEPLNPEYRLADAATGERLGYAWCAWDTLFLPALLGRSLDVRAADGRTGAPITLTVDPGGARRTRPAGAVVSFAAPNERWASDVLATFCHKVLFFSDQAGADAWIAARPDELFAVPVDEAFEIGRRWTADRYRDSLPPWRPAGPGAAP